MFTITERLITTLWVGGLWAIGYLAVPTLFARLDDRVLAGELAGHMFSALAYLGLACGGLLLGAELWRRAGRVGRSLRFWLLLGMLAGVVIGQFLLQPQMAALKLQGIGEGTAAAAEFARLHGIASAIYLAVSLLGLILVIRPEGRIQGN